MEEGTVKKVNNEWFMLTHFMCECEECDNIISQPVWVNVESAIKNIIKECKKVK